MNIYGLILRIAGWNVDVTVPDYPKCIICVAPHTSNWDFILGKLAYASIGRKAGFLMKSTWFFFPLGYIFKAIGGIPVPRKRGSAMTDIIINKFNSATKLTIAITPEGTRSRTSDWRYGFLYIAMQSKLPIALGVIDYASKRIFIRHTFYTTGNVDNDMIYIKSYYKDYTGKYPDKFTI